MDQVVAVGKHGPDDGTVEIMEATATSITIRLEFYKPMKSVNLRTFILTTERLGTRVTWSMAGESTGFHRLFMFFVSMDKLVGKDFEKGLAQLAATVSGMASPQ